MNKVNYTTHNGLKCMIFSERCDGKTQCQLAVYLGATPLSDWEVTVSDMHQLVRAQKMLNFGYAWVPLDSRVNLLQNNRFFGITLAVLWVLILTIRRLIG